MEFFVYLKSEVDPVSIIDVEKMFIAAGAYQFSKDGVVVASFPDANVLYVVKEGFQRPA